MDKKMLFRLASILYSNTDNADISKKKIINKIIESVFISNNNKELTVHMIVDLIKDNYELEFIDEEVNEVIKKYNYNYHILSEKKNNVNLMKLVSSRYEHLNNKYNEEENEIIIESFLEANSKNLNIYDYSINDYKILFDKFFYHLIGLSKTQVQNLIDNQSTHVLLLNDLVLIENEKEIINYFLNWKNEKKNEYIFKIYNLGIEYSLITTNKSNKNIIQAINNKIFYLDCNIIFRGIGLNGILRKKRVETFLTKCLENSEEIKISKFTDIEFQKTINYYVNEIRKYHSGKSFNNNLFRKMTKNESIYHFYQDWRFKNPSVPFDFFELHINEQYSEFLKKYKIEISYKEFFNEQDKEVIKEIKEIKSKIELHDERIKRDKNLEFDALNILLINHLRNGNSNIFIETKYYIISTDKSMLNWSYNSKQPHSLYPSQWMGILLKYKGRSDNDFKSFIEFLNLKTNENVINDKDAFIISQGISSVVEKLENQKQILNHFLEKDMIRKISDFDNELDKFDFITTSSIKYYDEILLENDEKEKQLNKSLDEKEKRITEKNNENLLLKTQVEEQENKLREKESKIKSSNKNHEIKEKQLKFLKDKEGNRKYRNFLFINIGLLLFGLMFFLMNIEGTFFGKIKLNPVKKILEVLKNYTDSNQASLITNYIWFIITFIFNIFIYIPIKNLITFKNKKNQIFQEIEQKINNIW